MATPSPVSQVESTVKADVAAVQADESKLSRTQLAWAGAALGLIVGQLIALLFKI